MNLTRRELLQIGGKISAAQAFGTLGPIGCSIGRPQPTLIRSRVHPPAKFRAALPLLPVLKAVRDDGMSRYFDLRVKESTINILEGMKTTIWGYDGPFPGPTIEARAGMRTVLTLHNDLPVPIVNHLHGGHTPAESDGYPDSRKIE